DRQVQDPGGPDGGYRRPRQRVRQRRQLAERPVEQVRQTGGQRAQLGRGQAAEDLVKGEAAIQQVGDVTEQVPQQVARAGLGGDVQADRAGIDLQAQQVQVNRVQVELENWGRGRATGAQAQRQRDREVRGAQAGVGQQRPGLVDHVVDRDGQNRGGLLEGRRQRRG